MVDRYEFDVGHCPNTGQSIFEKEDVAGEWVKYSDHLKALADVRAEAIEECAKVVETQDRGANYEWINGSFWGTMTKKFAAMIRRLGA